MHDGNVKTMELGSRGPDSKNTLTRELLNKVPEITVYFWVIKVLCTTVGETASDFLNTTLHFGLTGTSIVTGTLLALVLYFQVRSKQYKASIYWLAVVLISIFGTLITDNLTDKLGVPLETTTVVFSVALALTFAIWFAKEKTLSIHTIFTRRRETFYWLAILVTFALGTAAGDLMAERLALGYFVPGVMFAVLIAAVGVAWRFGLNPVLAFWIAYVLTRPLGASLGDYLSQATKDGGLGLGPVITSIIFLSAILIAVIYLMVTKKDVSVKQPTETRTITNRYAAVMQIAAAVAVLVIAPGAVWWFYRPPPVQTAPASPLGDLSGFRQIAQDTLALVEKGDLPAAKSRITDLESAWDKAEGRLRPLDSDKWSSADQSIDRALRALRSGPPDAGACGTTLKALIAMFQSLDKKQ